MQLRYVTSAIKAQSKNGDKVSAIAYSPNNKKLAVCTEQKVIRLFDELGEQRDKFSTKPLEKGTDYRVKGLAWSPDSTKLGIAQSDNIVFVYKLGLNFGEKKSICNKYAQNSSVTTLVWPRANEVIYGLAEGKVKVGMLRTNKPASLYSTESMVTALAANSKGVVSAHLDGSIHRFFFSSGSDGRTKIAIHPCIVYALAYGSASILAGGNDGTLFVYNEQGELEQRLTTGGSTKKEYTIAAMNPAGDAVVLGTTQDEFKIFSFQQNQWRPIEGKSVKNLYAISALAWKADGTALAVGSQFGALDLYDACLRRYRYDGKFEFTYSALSQVVVKRLDSGTRIVLKSLYGCEITKINIYHDRYVVANGKGVESETLLLGDLDTYKLSEIAWSNGGKESFVFDFPGCCLVHHAGELVVVEYGSNDVAGTLRTDFISAHLLSVRIGAEEEEKEKLVAYLLDAHTINIKYLDTHRCTTISHDSKIDWLELNVRGSHILFRDKARKLHLFQLETETRQTLLDWCTYVQWVPDADVIVAQQRSQLCVWYNIQTPDQVTLHEINGNIEDIERLEGRTEVIVAEQLSTAAYLLDEALINFSTALEKRNFFQAADILQDLELSPEAQAMWKRLEQVALEKDDFQVAERCAASLCDVAKARSLHRHHERQINTKHNTNKENFIQTNQAFKVAAQRAQAGDYNTAVDLYLASGMPGKASALVLDHRLVGSQLDRVAKALTTAGLHEKAGSLFEMAGQYRIALEEYVRGHEYKKAVELARTHAPERVVSLHEDWGDSLLEQNFIDMAINHYIEAGASAKAIEAALMARQWSKAESMLDGVSENERIPFMLRLARHYEDTEEFPAAERLYVDANAANEAVDMYSRLNEWEEAHRVAKSYMEPRQVRLLGLGRAQRLEEDSRFLEAEKMYLAVDEPDLAINMFKKNRDFSAMIRLVEHYRPELLKETHQFLGQQLEAEGDLSGAERHFCEAGEWLSAVNMYRTNEMWPEAMQVAKLHGGADASKRVAYAWALSLGGEAGAKVLAKQNLVEPAIDYAVESGAFDHAFELAHSACVAKLPEIHLKFALYLEDEERYEEAEIEFIKAEKPREAIDMYLHQHNWLRATAVMTQHDPSAAPDVFSAQAKACAENGQMTQAEELYVKAGRPELALKAYKDIGQMAEARRVAQRHLPHLANDEELLSPSSGDLQSKSAYLVTGRKLEQNQDYRGAIELYLSANSSLQGNDLIDVWNAAVLLAENKLPRDQSVQIISDVAKRVLKLGCFDRAIELYTTLGDTESALSCAIQARYWERAAEIAAGSTELASRLDAAKRMALRQAEDADGLMEHGAETAAYDLLAQRREWDKLWHLIAQKSFSDPVKLQEFCKAHIECLIADDEACAALRILSEKPVAPSIVRHIGLYRKLVRKLLGGYVHKENDYNVIADLRATLLEIAQKQDDPILTNPSEESQFSAFGRLVMATHYTSLYLNCLQNGLKDLSLKIAVSILRFSDIIPADKAFYKVGILARDLNETSLAFISLNRYIDIAEAIDDQIDTIDDADLQHTSLPLPTVIPIEHFVADENDREAVRDWVLASCVDNKIDQQLPESAKAANGTLYQALFPTEYPSCLVTGFPVASWDATKVQGGGSCNKLDYNRYVRALKICPWSNDTSVSPTF
uniref:IF140/IFT172/WDR19 TPR domain-containing protein n=1 Tax=Aureoumbra lagunensis TaxID=44058 RepID=A0A7S3K758_9STRA